jgi:hypothetical protein
MSEYLLKRKNLVLYEVIPGPGTFLVKVASTVTSKHLYELDKYPRYIVNLRVATAEGFEKCLSLMGSRETIEYKEVSPYFMSGVLWLKDIDDTKRLPTKGEETIATFDYVDDVLRCVSLTLIPRRTLAPFDLNKVCKSRKLLKLLMNETDELHC